MVHVLLLHLTILTIRLNGFPIGSCSIAKTSEQFSDEENEQEIERAIDEIIKHDFMNIYKKVKGIQQRLD